MRVALVSARALPLVGGIETHVDEVARRLSDRGVAVTILTTDTTGDLPHRQDLGGVSVERFTAWPRGGDLCFSPRLARVLTADRFDVVHVQGVHTLIPPLALRAAHRSRLPSVLTFHTGGHSSALRRALRPVQWRSLRPLLRATDRLVAVCEYEIDYFSSALGLPRSRFDLVRNGCDTLPVDPGAAPAPPGRPLILSVGRLEKYKGHHRVIAAMPEMRRRFPDARLVIVGHGRYEAGLRKRAATLGVSDMVSFLSFGPDQRGSLGALLRGGDVVALLSEYEAHPVAVMEALALGTPVVVADTSGLSELVRQGLATAVPLAASPSEVATALLDAAARAAPSGGTAALASWDDCTEQLLDIYGRVTTCGS